MDASILKVKMATRDADWLRQAKRDLEHARHALEDEDYTAKIIAFCEDKIF